MWGRLHANKIFEYWKQAGTHWHVNSQRSFIYKNKYSNIIFHLRWARPAVAMTTLNAPLFTNQMALIIIKKVTWQQSYLCCIRAFLSSLWEKTPEKLETTWSASTITINPHRIEKVNLRCILTKPLHLLCWSLSSWNESAALVCIEFHR